jgi:hypothetical protein
MSLLAGSVPAVWSASRDGRMGAVSFARVRTIDRICPRSRPSRQRQRSTASGGKVTFNTRAPITSALSNMIPAQGAGRDEDASGPADPKYSAGVALKRRYHNPAHCPILCPATMFGDPAGMRSTGGGVLSVQIKLPPMELVEITFVLPLGPPPLFSTSTKLPLT